MGDPARDFSFSGEESEIEGNLRLSAPMNNSMQASGDDSLSYAEVISLSKDAISTRTATENHFKAEDIRGHGEIKKLSTEERGEKKAIKNMQRESSHHTGNTSMKNTTISTLSAFEHPPAPAREPELPSKSAIKHLKRPDVSSSHVHQTGAIDILDTFASHNSFATIPLHPSSVPLTSDHKSLYGRLSHNLEALPDAFDARPRRFSSSTRDVSRFFPRSPVELNPRAAAWASSQSTNVFSTTNSPVSPSFLDTVGGLALPSVMSNIDGNATRLESTNHWASQAGYQLHSPSWSGCGSRPYAATASQGIAPIQVTKASSSSIPHRTEGPTTPSVMPVAEHHSISRATSPSTDLEFFRPRALGRQVLASPAHAPALKDTLGRTGLGITSTPCGPRSLSKLPRRATNIDSHEKGAEVDKFKSSLSTTSPTSSWVTELPHRRSNNIVSQSSGSEDNDFKHVPPRPSSMGTANSTMTSQITHPRALGPFPSILTPGIPQASAMSEPAQSSTLTKATPRGSHRPLKPMNNVLFPENAKKPLSEEERASRIQIGISPNYQGNPLNPKNRSADIPDRENCALFLTNLPARCSYQDLLQALALHRPGRIFSTYINRPRSGYDHAHPETDASAAGLYPRYEEEKTSMENTSNIPSAAADGLAAPRYVPASYKTSAAKVIFYHPHEAQRLLAAAVRGDLRVGRRKASGRLNRHRTAAQGPAQERTSRVLRIAGPAALVREDRLRTLFARFFEYHTESVLVLAEGEEEEEPQKEEGVGRHHWRVLEWRFASLRAQAEVAFQLLQNEYAGVVEVQYAVDPCAGYLSMEEGREGPMVLGSG